MTKEAMLQELVSRAEELLRGVAHIEYFEFWQEGRDWYNERDEWLRQLNYAQGSQGLMNESRQATQSAADTV